MITIHGASGWATLIVVATLVGVVSARLSRGRVISRAISVAREAWRRLWARIGRTGDAGRQVAALSEEVKRLQGELDARVAHDKEVLLMVQANQQRIATILEAIQTASAARAEENVLQAFDQVRASARRRPSASGGQ